jgi:NADPH:quinone reductase-like Zn-dependent oxidoreductase
MQGVVRERYGPPDVLEIREIDKPATADNEVLVRVQAASVNPLDWHMLTGVPYIARLAAGLRQPKTRLVGTDFAGTVEAVGKDVKQFRPGDAVFGARSGALAEYVCVPEERAIVEKPANVTFEEAAAVPVAAVTALQALRDKGQIRAGQKVLINGASGGVGTFAIQIAKSFGADVTAVCSTPNVDTARSLGADRVIDYTKEDFTRRAERYDLMIDIAGNRSRSASKRVLAERAICVQVGGPKTNRWIGPLGTRLVRDLTTRRAGRRFVLFLATINKEAVLALRELLEAGKLKPVIDRAYPLHQVTDAFRHVGGGHARGKVVVRLGTR